VAPVGGRRDDGQQVLHPVTAHRSESQVAAQRARKNSCAVRVPSLKLQIDEPAQFIGRWKCQFLGVGVAPLLEERPQDVQTLNPGVLRQAPGVLHVLFEAVQFVFNSAGSIALAQKAGARSRRHPPARRDGLDPVGLEAW